MVNKSLEEMSLITVTQDKDLKKLFNEWSTFGKYHEPVLIDHCQYWHKNKGCEQDNWWIMLRYNYYCHAWELSLWTYNHIEHDNTPAGPGSVFKILCSGWQIQRTTHLLWSASQHIRLKKPDGRNVVWDETDAFNWLEPQCREAHMLIKRSPCCEYELHYLNERGD